MEKNEFLYFKMLMAIFIIRFLFLLGYSNHIICALDLAE